jgi:hypothetical protein
LPEFKKGSKSWAIEARALSAQNQQNNNIPSGERLVFSSLV